MPALPSERTVNFGNGSINLFDGSEKLHSVGIWEL
jgi:hypothetical protein